MTDASECFISISLSLPSSLHYVAYKSMRVNEEELENCAVRFLGNGIDLRTGGVGR